MSGSKPIKMWIQGKTFPIQKFSEITRKLNKPKKDIENDGPSTTIPHEEYIKLLDITEDEGNFTTRIQVPKLYRTKLFTLPKFDVAQISKETNTAIIIPLSDGNEGDITFRSETTLGLVKAVAHIHSAIAEVRNRTLPFQFTCIPCSTPSIRVKFENLKKQILDMQEEVNGLHESIFISPLKLHITIDVYSLLDDEKLEAIRVLNEYKSTLDKLGPMKINIATLSCMNDNIKKTDVIYANVKLLNETENNNLQKIINDISHNFYEKGLLKKYQENVKLHMTIINTKYRKDKESPKRKRRRLSIDARKIIEKFKDFEFGVCDFDSLHLSHMTLKGDDGFYKPLAVIKLGD